MSWIPPNPPPRPGAGASTQQQPTGEQRLEPEELSYYQLLQVDRDAHPTIIRYSYRFLAAMYHPDNGETGNADKFRVITEAWKTLSDEGKRQAYDMSLAVKEQAKGIQAHKPQPKVNEFGRDTLPEFPKTTLTWNEVELRLAILQVLLAAKKKRPSSGGASGKMLMDCLNIDNIAQIEFALWYLREKGMIEMGERVFMITAKGLDYLTEELSKTQILDGGSKVEQKTAQIVRAGLPATLK